MIAPASHPSAYAIFSRDIARVCEYFARQGLRSDPARLAAGLWKAHGFRRSPEVHPAWLDADDPADRKLWQKNREE